MTSSIFMFVIVILIFFGGIILWIIAGSRARYHAANQKVDNRTIADYGVPAKSLYTSSKIFTLRHHIDITDENDNIAYTSQSKIISLHDKTNVYTASGEHVAFISRKLFTLHERHYVTMENGKIFELSNELFHIIKDITNIEGLGWVLKGNILQMNFVLEDKDGSVIAQVGQKFLSIHDKYCVDIYKPEYEEEVVAILVTLIHMNTDRAAASSASSSSSSSSSSSASH